MQVELIQCGKRFRNQWVFRQVNLVLSRGDRLAICGGNGSGKSTLLATVAGYTSPSEGQVLWSESKHNAPQLLSWAGPQIQLLEELTVQQHIRFHFKLKSLLPGFQVQGVPKALLLETALNKQVSELSSGMKQRLKLGLAVLSNTPLLLLDEPTNHLDSNGILWFQELLKQHLADRTLVVASNHNAAETAICNSQLTMEDLKPKA